MGSECVADKMPEVLALITAALTRDCRRMDAEMVALADELTAESPDLALGGLFVIVRELLAEVATLTGRSVDEVWELFAVAMSARLIEDGRRGG